MAWGENARMGRRLRSSPARPTTSCGSAKTGSGGGWEPLASSAKTVVTQGLGRLKTVGARVVQRQALSQNRRIREARSLDGIDSRRAICSHIVLNSQERADGPGR